MRFFPDFIEVSILLSNSILRVTKKPKARKKKAGRPKGDKETFSIRLSAPTRERLERAVEKTKHSLSAYMELALIDRLQKDDIP